MPIGIGPLAAVRVVVVLLPQAGFWTSPTAPLEGVEAGVAAVGAAATGTLGSAAAVPGGPVRGSALATRVAVAVAVGLWVVVACVVAVAVVVAEGRVAGDALLVAVCDDAAALGALLAGTPAGGAALGAAGTAVVVPAEHATAVTRTAKNVSARGPLLECLPTAKAGL